MRSPFAWRLMGLSMALWGCVVTSASASDCSFAVKGASAIPDAAVLRTLRCLVVELDRLQRENAALKERLRRENAALEKRLRAAEALLTELPAAYSNIDGVITQDEGRAIDTATFVLSARSTGGASALPIDQRVLEEVCGTRVGCSISIAFRHISLFNDTPKDSTLTGPCQFTYAPDDGAWSIGGGCETGALSGIDGDRFADEDPTVEPVILGAQGACLFSESAPSRSVGESVAFQSDFSPGLFLVSLPLRQAAGIRRYQCELVLN
ncbi:MAG: hypothetical protein AAF222_09445 [Pseudomonadota bacterium]